MLSEITCKICGRVVTPRRSRQVTCLAKACQDACRNHNRGRTLKPRDPDAKLNRCLGYKFGTKEQCENLVPAPRHFCPRCRELQIKYPSGSTWWGNPI